ncbi:hypothetical protein SO802_020316 [Lithocarpus litseifolius]|uniref:RNase H type-1 domain-containing protein n=1 Tax=Lithocarpus litseifolius TaxID=425828 RepID=A0AAW2CBG5_9ROSI
MPFIMMLAALHLKVIIRDHSGTTVGALNKLLPSAFPASIIEAFALLQGVLFAAKMGSTKAIFESDALDPIQAVNTNENGGVLGHILQDIRSSALVFKRSSFQHLKRDGNRVAHELARDAKLRLLAVGSREAMEAETEMDTNQG